MMMTSEMKNILEDLMSISERFKADDIESGWTGVGGVGRLYCNRHWESNPCDNHLQPPNYGSHIGCYDDDVGNICNIQ